MSRPPANAAPLPDDATGESSAFARLDHRIQQFLWREGWTELRAAQERAIGPILDTDHDVIIAAATASGKTEAAFLPALTRLLRSREPRLIIYVSPLKALINDQFGRLDRLCEQLELPVWPWHGDISASVKQRFWRNPHGVLLITPESMEAMFCNRGGALAGALARTEIMVVDELHAFIGSERGRQLQSLLHRAQALAGRRLPRVGLSATLGDMTLAAEFLRPGEAAQVALIEERSHGAELRVLVKGYLEPKVSAATVGPDDDDEPITPGQIAAHLFGVLRGSNNLVFPNSRREVERYTHLLREHCQAAGIANEFWPHHGSLSREVREDTEFALKRRESGAPAATAICTNTLELGIDIGAVKCVVQIGPAPTVASLRQRLGRSGRRAGEPAILRGYVNEAALDQRSGLASRLRLRTVRLIAQIELMLTGWCEPPAPRGLFLSTLIQQVLSLAVERGGVLAVEAYALLCRGGRRAGRDDGEPMEGPFGPVSPAVFAKLLRALGAREVLMQDPSGLLLPGRVGERMVNHYSFYAAFADQEEFRVENAGRLLGTLPMDNLLRVDQRILFAGRTWRVIAIDMERKAIDVSAEKGGAPPRFDGGGGRSHRRVHQQMRELLAGNAQPAYLDADARAILAEGRDTYRRLDLDRQWLVRDGSAVHLFTWLGDDANEALALLLAGRGWHADNDGLGVLVELGARDVDALAKDVMSLGDATAGEMASALAQSTNLAREKWDGLLDPELLADNFTSRFLDVEAARQWAAEARAVASGSVSSGGVVQ